MKAEKQETGQEQKIREALERFVQQTTQAHGLVDDTMGGDDLLKTHGQKIRWTNKGPSFWDEPRNGGKGLTIVLISRRPAVAGETALIFEQPLTLLESHEELTRAVNSYPYADPSTQSELRQKICRLAMGPNPAKPPELMPDVSLVAFLIYIGDQTPIPIRIATQN